MAEKKTEQFYTPPPKLSKWEGFKIFLWNSETSQFLGRTGSSWAKIITFYIIFYAFLIGFFAALLAIFYQTLDYKKPKWQLDRSIIGTNPGLGFRPMPPASNVESTLIWYKSSDRGNTQHWHQALDEFLEIYKNRPESSLQNTQPCISGVSPPQGKVCAVTIDHTWSPCTGHEKYNFNSNDGGPCIFLKLNKIYGWEPSYYNKTDLPEIMPEFLKEHIRGENDLNKMRTVWVSCEGENPADVENIGPIRFHPAMGFEGQYFPFLNQDDYLSPLVSVHFEKPRRGVLINIECKAWAKNIHHDRAERRGSVHFELMID